MKIEIKEEYRKLADARSLESNLLKLAEESGELTQAACKFIEEPSQARRQAIVEEMVDTAISMLAVYCALGITDAEVTDMHHHKMVRNMQRIGG